MIFGWRRQKKDSRSRIINRRSNYFQKISWIFRFSIL